MTKSLYQERIRQIVRDEFDPRHVEAYMRCEKGTLDGLSAHEFVKEAAIACACIAEGGTDAAEALAKTYGL